MDDDGSGKITYTELADLVRNELQLDERQCPDLRLRGVWRALDADGSGYLTAGEFGHFMKRGEAHLQQLHPEQSWKQLLHRERRAQKEAVEEYLRNEMSGGAAADAFASVKAATASEVAEMASAMTRRMHELYVGRSAAWFRLFKHMDSDGSGRVTYGEFAELVRSELEISSADLPEENLKSVWRSLDSDDSGFITTAEFGRFMRKGEEGMGQVSTTWRKKLHAKLHKEREEFEAVLYKEARAMEGVRPASEGDCDDLARVLNRQMKAMFKGNPTWYQLFRHMDTDRTGNITFAELLGLVRLTTPQPRDPPPHRHTPHLTPHPTTTPSSNLRAVWKSIAGDDGYITGGEFGQFMRKGEVLPPRETLVERRRAASARVRRSIEEETAARAAQQTSLNYKSIVKNETEAQRLQRQLEALQRLNASSRSMWSTTDPNRSGTSQSARSPRLPPAGRPNTSQSARH